MADKYSGKQIIKAGEKLRDDNLINDKKEYAEATDILSYWRFCHEVSLNNAFSKVQLIAFKYDKKAIFAKRLKRYVSIVKKLKRFRRMKLKNMQDIGGCRIILSNEKILRRIVKELKKADEFKHNGKYKVKDYIKKPKEDGYRSYHLVGKFMNLENKSMSIEVQLRTQIQHYWATALEIVDLFTGQALKSNQGDEEWKLFFNNISKQFSEIEKIHSFKFLPAEDQQKAYQQLLRNDSELLKSCKKTQKYSKKLKVRKTFEAFYASLKVIDEGIVTGANDGYILLEIDIAESTLNYTLFPDSDGKIAEEAYINSERSSAEAKTGVVALVSTTALGDIKEAYPNYFADSSEFRTLLELVDSIALIKEKSFFSGLFSPTKESIID